MDNDNEWVIEGKIKFVDNGDGFDIDLIFQDSQLNFKGLNNVLLLKKLKELKKEQGIYILEGEDKCYVGQTKDLSQRIKCHKDNKKVNFTKCFFLSQKGGDLRQYLDYMEAYTIEKMDSRGYDLDNLKRPDSEKDMLDDSKKNMVKKWIKQFLICLPILGFKKIARIKEVKVIEIKIEKEINSLKINFNEQLVIEKDARSTVFKFLEKVGIEQVFHALKDVKDFNTTLFKIKKEFNEPKHGSCKTLIYNNENYYMYFNISKKELIKKLKKIILIMDIKAEVIE